MNESTARIQNNVIQFNDIKSQEKKYILPPELMEDFSQFLKTKTKVAKSKKNFADHNEIYAAKEYNKTCLKNKDDINKISNYFLNNGKIRWYLLWIIGCNTTLRISDILRIKWKNILNEDKTIKDELVLVEKKTSTTRTILKNRHIYLNSSIRNAINLLIENLTEIQMDDFIFISESNNGKGKVITRQSVDRLLKQAAKDVNLSKSISTHTMRRSGTYQMWANANKSEEALTVIQSLLNHSTPIMSIKYLGIQQEDIKNMYENLNLE